MYYFPFLFAFFSVIFFLSTCSPLFSLLLPSLVPVFLLVIYSGQSVPPFSPSPRGDEDEWCCFIMYLSQCGRKTVKKEGRVNVGYREGGFENWSFLRNLKKNLSNSKSEERASQEGGFNYLLWPTSQSGRVVRL